MDNSVITFAGYILLFIVILFMIKNFISISISDTKNSGKCISNSLYNNNSTNMLQSNLPSPVYSSKSNKLNSVYNLQDQMDDYHRQFYLPPYNRSSA